MERNPTSCELEIEIENGGVSMRLRENTCIPCQTAAIHPSIHPSIQLTVLHSGVIKHRDNIDIHISAQSHLPLQDTEFSGHGSESNTRGYGISAYHAKVVHVVNGFERSRDGKPRRVMASDAIRSGSADPPP